MEYGFATLGAASIAYGIYDRFAIPPSLDFLI
jgi:hypothetical protein